MNFCSGELIYPIIPTAHECAIIHESRRELNESFNWPSRLVFAHPDQTPGLEGR